MANYSTIGINDHSIAEIVKSEVMPATHFNSFVFKELSELFICNSLFFHGNLLVSILKSLWAPKADYEISIEMLT